MSIELLSQVPVYQIEAVGDLHHPAGDDLESGIISSLGFGQEVVRVGSHSLISLQSPLPHHPEGSRVLWTVSNGRGVIEPWGEGSWERVIADGEYLEAVEAYLREQGKDGFQSYMGIGFVLPETIGTCPDGVIPRAVQTQPRMHLHLVPGLWEKPGRYLNTSHVGELFRGVIFLDTAGDASRQAYEEEIDGFFGAPFHFQQIVGDSALTRTYFGAESLQDALAKALDLQRDVMAGWISHAVELGSGCLGLAQAAAAEITNLCRQSCYPNVQIFFPSAVDKARLGSEDNYPVWVLPLSVCGPQDFLNGHITFR